MSNPILSAAEHESLYAARLRLMSLPAERIIDVQTAPAALQLHRLNGEPAEVREAALAFLKAVNELCDGVLRKQSRGVNRSSVQAAEEGFAVLGRFGLGTDEPAAFLRSLRDARAAERHLDVAGIDAAITARAAARAERDFATADRLQQELLARGVVLNDHATGSEWTLTTSAPR
jgi:cysteinyl-tRNA synthetase